VNTKRREEPAPEESEGRGSIVFLVVVLVALGVFPVASAGWVASLEREVEEVFEPARADAEDLSILHVRQMLSFQEWLLTGDFEVQSRYHDLREESDVVLEELRARVVEADVDVPSLHLPVVAAAQDWHTQHATALNEVGRTVFLEGPAVAADQRRFGALVQATEALLDELNVRTQAARRRVATARDFLLLANIGLVGVALIGAAVVAALSRRLRGLVRDVRSRHRDALQSRRELDAIFDATGDAVVEVDADGRVARVNPAATRMLGWSEADARGEPVERLMLGATPPRGEVSTVVEAARAGRVVDGAEGEVRARRGREIPVLWSTRPLEEGDARRGVVVTLTDLTEIRAATEALQRAIKAREETLAVVSHDLRSPLATVQAVGELLVEVPLDRERREAQLRNLLRASARMERLIQDLMDIARIDGGGLVVRPSPVEAASLVEAGFESMWARAERAGIALRRVGDLDGVRVHADADRILQVWENLISNALRHTEEGGVVTLRAERTNAGVDFRVEDTGSGIPEEALPQLFDRFWRADQLRREGAGLGLTIVRGIVEAHGGRIRVASEVGRGTTFAFTLPEAGRATA